VIHDNGISNRSNNRPFEDILRARLSRRNLLARSAMLGASGFLAALAGDKLLAQGAAAATGANPEAGLAGGELLAQARKLVDFPIVPVSAGSGPVPAISSAYEYDILIPWGSPLQGPGQGPNYNGDPKRRPSSAEQAQQIGIGHDGMWYFPLDQGNDNGMLAINHEYGTNSHVIGKDLPTSLEDVRVSQHAHGVSVVEIRRVRGAKWQAVPSPRSRRIHVNTPVTFSGPAANSPLLRTAAGNPPLGTLNNCANGKTPWGTYLTCEENFNGYFGDSTYNAQTKTGTWKTTNAQKRYGFAAAGAGYGWELFDKRFDLASAEHANEENRFGWVVEIDPMNPNQTPVKRTALGRIKHEGAEVVEGRGGRIVVYMGDDERFDYIYKFVSADNWRSMRARGVSPLDEGKLYVAKFNDNGTGSWLEMNISNPALRGKFSDQAEVLTYARLAADALGATPMDRPEWITAAANGRVYCTLTNNTQRKDTQVNAANPLGPNPDGHIISWRDSDDYTGTSFTWDIFILAKDTHGNGDERTFSSPDGLWADPDGRLFIETDGTQKKGLNDQLLVANLETGDIRRLLTGVTDCEVTGITVTPDRRTMFVNLQHPGDGNPAKTNFPAPQGSGRIPRDCTLVIRKKDGGIIGS
jgi:secreted PhoX family phosphatase